ncbi:hypothetical protein PENFLA_c015G08372 [Penicillium flavigenum]|uniref:Protein kinase domain-containing protein n=1 Tax=Penicillium flavigenum TaxID=254877 RepID=A0A1V6T3S1_9EURO|nr:hypothetical protein PENFLA_c015G08372 [Penicillium flavigenum]
MNRFHENGDPGYAENSCDLNRFRRESNAYEKLLISGVCERGFVPKFYGYIDLDPAEFHPFFKLFTHGKFKAERTIARIPPKCREFELRELLGSPLYQAIEAMKEIHKAGVHHRDTYPRNLLLIRGNPDRLVWTDFDVATTFTDTGPKDLARSDYEIELVKGFGPALGRLCCCHVEHSVR